jgi:hypothetical protein
MALSEIDTVSPLSAKNACHGGEKALGQNRPFGGQNSPQDFSPPR